MDRSGNDDRIIAITIAVPPSRVRMLKGSWPAMIAKVAAQIGSVLMITAALVGETFDCAHTCKTAVSAPHNNAM